MASQGSPEPPAGSAVRTFLFVDVRGYTRYIVEHGDAAGVPLLERFVAVARRAVATHQGQIIGRAGDEVVAVFESCRESLRAALLVQSDLDREPEAAQSGPIEVGIGLDTGEAIPSGDTYVGAALNLAARLCKLAGPKEVLASESVIHVAGKLDGVAYAERGLVQLKGFGEPVHVFRVVDESAPTATTGPLGPPGTAAYSPPGVTLPLGGFLGALPSSELVAREREMERALRSADAVVAGSGRLVVLSGEPGVGKTRLAQEIMLNLRNRKFLVATGRCYELQREVPFYPFLDILQGVFLLAPPKLRAGVPSRWPYLGRLLPGYAPASLPKDGSRPEEQQRLFRDVSGFVQALASELPVALMVDDLQWADGASLELLEHLTRATRADRVILVATYRDVEVGRHHPLESALRNLLREDLIERIPIRRLEPPGTVKLVTATLGEGGVSDEIGALIHQHSEGNPFFTQQLVRFFVERGNLYRKDGHWTESALSASEVPESIRSVIGQRIERLQGSTQEVLRQAAVLGVTFSFDELASLAGRAEAEVEAALEEARSAGLVEERRADVYAFDHALTQQTLYGELPPRRRRRLHQAAGEALERLPEADRVARSAELAWHFLEAAQELRAIPYSLAAGDRASAVFAYREAEQQYTSALEIADHADDQGRIVEALSRRAKLYADMWKGKAAVSDYERLLDLARRQKDRHLELRSRLGVARSSYIVALDETERDLASQSLAMYESASSLADELGDERAKVEALLGTRWFADFFPSYRTQVRKNVSEALEISRRLHDEALVLRAELANWWNAPRPEAKANSERLIRQLKERRDFHHLNALYFSLMWAYTSWGEFERAVETCDAGIRLAEEIGVPPVQYPTLKAMALLHLGRYGDAWEALQHEVTDAQHPFGRAMQSLGLATYYLEVQDSARAEETARDLLVRAKQLHRAWMTRRGSILLARCLLRSGRLGPEAWTGIQDELRRAGGETPAALRAEKFLWEGNAEAALPEAKAAETEAKQEDEVPDLLVAQELRARALLALGETSEGVAIIENALRSAEELCMAPQAWKLLELKSRALTTGGDLKGAQVARGEAARLVRRVGESIPEIETRNRFFRTAAVKAALDGAV